MNRQNRNNNNKKLSKAQRSLDRGMEQEIYHLKADCEKFAGKEVMAYVDSVADPFNGPKTGVPTSSGGFVPRSATASYFTDVVVTTNTDGVGWLIFSPGFGYQDGGIGAASGFYRDQFTAWHTGASYIGTDMPRTQVAGVSGAAFTSSNYTVGQDVDYRVVSAGVKITPTASALAQDGTIRMLEFPNHVPPTGAISPSTMTTYPQTRLVSGIVNKDPIYCNWHPVGNKFRTLDNKERGAVGSDFEYISRSTPDALSVLRGEIVVCFTGAPGVTYNCRLVANYEYYGLPVHDAKARKLNSSAMEHALFAFARKQQSGYRGQPSQARHGYAAAMWKSLKREAPRLVNKYAPSLVQSVAAAFGFL